MTGRRPLWAEVHDPAALEGEKQGGLALGLSRRDSRALPPSLPGEACGDTGHVTANIIPGV